MASTEKFWVAIFWGGMSVFNSTQLNFLLYPRLAMVLSQPNMVIQGTTWGDLPRNMGIQTR